MGHYCARSLHGVCHFLNHEAGDSCGTPEGAGGCKGLTMGAKRNFLGLGPSSVTYRRRGVSSSPGERYKGYRIWEDENGWHTSLDPGSWFDSKKDVKRFMDDWMKNPPKGWFKRCVKAVKAKGGAYDPNAVCAAEERRLGKRRNVVPLATLAGEIPTTQGALAGSEKWLKKHGVMPKRKRGNPEAESAEAFEKFHGYAPKEFVDVDKDLHYHSKLGAIGTLEKLTVIARNGTLVDLSGFKGAILAMNEDMTQLYIEGGDQSVNCEEFGIREPYHDKEKLGQVKKIWYFTNKTHLGSEGGKAVYHHTFGEEGTIRDGSGRAVKSEARPDLVYDTMNETLEFVGGEYLIEAEGIKN